MVRQKLVVEVTFWLCRPNLQNMTTQVVELIEPTFLLISSYDCYEISILSSAGCFFIARGESVIRHSPKSKTKTQQTVHLSGVCGV